MTLSRRSYIESLSSWGLFSAANPLAGQLLAAAVHGGAVDGSGGGGCSRGDGRCWCRGCLNRSGLISDRRRDSSLRRRSRCDVGICHDAKK